MSDHVVVVLPGLLGVSAELPGQPRLQRFSPAPHSGPDQP